MSLHEGQSSLNRALPSDERIATNTTKYNSIPLGELRTQSAPDFSVYMYKSECKSCDITFVVVIPSKSSNPRGCGVCGVSVCAEVFDDEELDVNDTPLTSSMPRSTSFQDLASESMLYEDVDEEDDGATSPLARQCHEIWQTVQLKSVWKPMVRELLHQSLSV
jgi:hypothetical protein